MQYCIWLFESMLYLILLQYFIWLIYTILYLTSMQYFIWLQCNTLFGLLIQYFIWLIDTVFYLISMQCFVWLIYTILYWYNTLLIQYFIDTILYWCNTVFGLLLQYVHGLLSYNIWGLAMHFSNIIFHWHWLIKTGVLLSNQIFDFLPKLQFFFWQANKSPKSIIIDMIRNFCIVSAILNHFNVKLPSQWCCSWNYISDL